MVDLVGPRVAMLARPQGLSTAEFEQIAHELDAFVDQNAADWMCYFSALEGGTQGDLQVWVLTKALPRLISKNLAKLEKATRD